MIWVTSAINLLRFLSATIIKETCSQILIKLNKMLDYGRIHRSLRVTPAREAGITDHIWSLEEIARLVKDDEPKKRGQYKKRISN